MKPVIIIKKQEQDNTYCEKLRFQIDIAFNGTNNTNIKLVNTFYILSVHTKLFINIPE